ncbi:ribonuclease P protein component [Candidatus Magnetominusculus dajiuhuensis]|uniref:ribonuclease P protein component n=1 Tax=Candidatus Magnetominusculus dajiuhuensis TaxID=3137712 RepID=UPI003B42FAD3
MSTLESLKKSFEFKYVFHNGRRYKAAHLGVYISKGKKRGVRVGLVVSKRVGNAVVRNKVKRRFREAMRNLPVVDAFGVPLDIVLLAGPTTPQAAYRDIYKELGFVLERHYAALK